MTRNSGFTLIELVVAVSVAAVLLAIGIPSFSGSVKQNQATTDANVVLTILNLARSEAIRRDQTVYLCASTNGSACDGASWTSGYCIYTNGATCSAATAIKVQAPLSTASTITATAPFATAISFNGVGFAQGAAAGACTLFTVTPNNLTSAQNGFARYVTVYPNGRLGIIQDKTKSSCS